MFQEEKKKVKYREPVNRVQLWALITGISGFLATIVERFIFNGAIAWIIIFVVSFWISDVIYKSEQRAAYKKPVESPTFDSWVFLLLIPLLPAFVIGLFIFDSLTIAGIAYAISFIFMYIFYRKNIDKIKERMRSNSDKEVI